MAGERQVPNYLDCGANEKGERTIVYFPALAMIEEQIDGQKKLSVELTFMTGLQRTLNGAHAVRFCENIGWRKPEGGKLYVPDVFSGINTQDRVRTE